MKFDRRQVLTAGGALLTSCSSARLAPTQTGHLDAVLDANASGLPELAGAGANHYPMAAEALEALGYADSIPAAWVDDATRYKAAPSATSDIDDWQSALGVYERFSDWRAFFRARLARTPWRTVVARWVPRLAPGLAGGAFHGIIRTGHAVRALRGRESAARQNELAVALAYWAARYTELPTTGTLALPADCSAQALATLDHPWLDERAEVDFFGVTERLTRAPIAPPLPTRTGDASPTDDLSEIVRAAGAGFLEMLVAERYRLWLLHTVTGPAAAGLLLPELEPAGARLLVEYSRQGVLAMYAAYGEPFEPGLHVRTELSTWPELIELAAQRGSVHGVKLIEALVRYERPDDPLFRSIAEQWFEWV